MKKRKHEITLEQIDRWTQFGDRTERKGKLKRVSKHEYARDIKNMSAILGKLISFPNFIVAKAKFKN